MHIGVSIGDVTGPVTLATITARAERADALGLHSVWLNNNPSWDPLTTLALVGQPAPDVELGTNIVLTYPRHPLILTSQALTVQAATGNRLQLGIGPGHRLVTEEWFGYNFDHPVQDLREYLEVLRPLLRGEAVQYRGESVRVNAQIAVPEAAPPPILISAMGPAMLRLTGELADGTVTASVGPRTLAEHIAPRINAAAAEAGRPKPRIVASVMVDVTDEPEVARARVAARFGMSSQLLAYRAMLDREGVAGYEDLLLTGDEAAVRAGLRAYREAGATELIAMVVSEPGAEARTEALLASEAAAAG
ncbi:MAG: TIGR03564 family F420-dependent LLM class oxidoreductase [Thermomicrobiales bacterium]